ncbi:hypothetical protein GA0070609_3203 [Micromonospora echinaurantiaca]|uniref:Uncharacterized protein n=1 Tax=Micromonospora echinaurantiaca TaxID=47857 RepID=A0A1C5IEX5_9ACTN|nr:hypothetical protein [Micromonospora echinaurantiaca]SCG56814.1 hypothetical protein GA0070609_3203 [Micromonospora echinaurantiaca]
MRRLTLPGILVLLLGLLAGCTPPDQPIVALSVQDGRPVGVLVTCDGAFSQLSVHEDDAYEGTGTSTRWHISGRPAQEVVEVPLLGPPPQGWDLHGSGETPAAGGGGTEKTRPLTELRPGASYGLGGRSSGNAITVTFTIADFDRIGPDQVLAPKDYRTTRVMTRNDFVRAARKSCD